MEVAKTSSLFQCGYNYSRKKFYSTGPTSNFHQRKTNQPRHCNINSNKYDTWNIVGQNSLQLLVTTPLIKKRMFCTIYYRITTFKGRWSSTILANVIKSSGHGAWPFCQLAICQLTILSTSCFINLLLCQLIDFDRRMSLKVLMKSSTNFG